MWKSKTTGTFCCMVFFFFVFFLADWAHSWSTIYEQQQEGVEVQEEEEGWLCWTLCSLSYGGLRRAEHTHSLHPTSTINFGFVSWCHARAQQNLRQKKGGGRKFCWGKVPICLVTAAIWGALQCLQPQGFWCMELVRVDDTADPKKLTNRQIQENESFNKDPRSERQSGSS